MCTFKGWSYSLCSTVYVLLVRISNLSTFQARCYQFLANTHERKVGHSLQSWSNRLFMCSTESQSLFMFRVKILSSRVFAIVIDTIMLLSLSSFILKCISIFPWPCKLLFLSMIPSVLELGVLSLIIKDYRAQWMIPGLLFHNVEQEHLLLLHYCVSGQSPSSHCNQIKWACVGFYSSELWLMLSSAMAFVIACPGLLKSQLCDLPDSVCDQASPLLE